MIHVIDNYYAIPYSTGFMVGRKTEKTDKKTGEPILKPCGYCCDLKEVCWLVMRERTNALASEKDMELAEVIKIMTETKEMIKKALQVEE